MIDIHSHIIPHVDDGSENMEMTMSMLLRAYDQGVRAFFATPHSSAFSPKPMRALDAFWDLKMMAKEYFPDVELFLGCEVRCEADRMDKVLKALRKGTYPTMNGTPYVLTEFSKWITPEDALTCVEKLTRAGWKPIIAHMERYEYLRGKMDVMERFRELDCLIQINAYSLFDEMDEDIKGWARQLTLDHKVDFLGTDMHRTYHRPPSAQMGVKWLRENCSAEYADAVAFGNARILLMKHSD